MHSKDDGFNLPTIEEKEQYVLNEVSELFSVFRQSAIKMSHMDKLNVTFRFGASPEIFKQLQTLPNMGYSETDSKTCSLYHKFDDETAVASNVSFDKERRSVIISVNM